MVCNPSFVSRPMQEKLKNLATLVASKFGRRRARSPKNAGGRSGSVGGTDSYGCPNQEYDCASSNGGGELPDTRFASSSGVHIDSSYPLSPSSH